MACEDTPLEGSRLVIEEVPVVVFCPTARRSGASSGVQAFCCAECGTPTPDIEQGRELELVALEIETMSHEPRLVEVRQNVLKQNDVVRPRAARSGSATPACSW